MGGGTGDLYIVNLMEPGVDDDAGAVYRCKSEDFTDTTVDCKPVLATAVLTQQYNLRGYGIAIAKSDGHLYFNAFGFAGSSFLFKLTGVDRNDLEALVVRWP